MVDDPVIRNSTPIADPATGERSASDEIVVKPASGPFGGLATREREGNAPVRVATKGFVERRGRDSRDNTRDSSLVISATLYSPRMVCR
jgi:hypothetical protein